MKLGDVCLWPLRVDFAGEKLVWEVAENTSKLLTCVGSPTSQDRGNATLAVFEQLLCSPQMFAQQPPEAEGYVKKK